MTFIVDIGWILAVGLVALRIGTVFALTPLFVFGSVPANVRVLFVLALAATLMAALGTKGLAFNGSLGEVIAAAASELVLGGLLAFGVFTAFAAFQFAGRIMDMQMGFGVASLIDPSTRTSVPLLGTVLNLAAVMVFFAIDGHHMIIRGLAFSFAHIPPGTPLGEVDPAVVLAQFGSMFVFALMLAAPVVFTVFLVDVAMAVMARTMPQMNVFIVSLPLKILVGLGVLAISLRYLNPVMMRIFEALFDYWYGLLVRP